MNVLLSHVDLGAIIYGLLMFTSLMIVYYKIVRMQLFSLTTTAVVWYAVFSLHGGTLTGGMSAMVAALLWDMFAHRIRKWWK